MLKKNIEFINTLLNKRERKQLSFFALIIILIAILETLSVVILPTSIALLLDQNAFLERLRFNEDLFSQVENLLNNINIFVLVSFVLFVFFLFKFLINVFSIIFESKFFNNLKISLSTQLFQIFSEKDYIFHSMNNPIILARTIGTDASTSINYIKSLMIIIKEFFIITMIAILLIYTNSKIFFIIFSIILLFVITYYSLIVPTLKNKVKVAFFERAEKMKIVNQVLNSIIEIQIYKKTIFFIKKFKVSIKREYDSTIFSEIISRFPRYFLEIFIISILSLTILFVPSDNFKIQNFLTTVLLYFFSALRVYPAINSILIQKIGLAQNKISIISVFNKISAYNNERKLLKNEKIKKIIFNEKIEIKNLTFKYPNRDKLLNNISANFKKNSVIGIIGQSGSGKSTFVKLIMGLLKPTDGEIIIDGKNTLNSKNDWKHNFGYISQNYYILDDTILNNIILGEEKCDLELVQEILKNVLLYDFINNLPNKLNTIVGPSGKLLSGGQLQRIAIARALYKNPNIFVFDEATSSLDSQTEDYIINKVYELKKSKTVFIITHKKNLLKNCDQILKFDNGNLNID